jgi:hypothetical protein
VSLTLGVLALPMSFSCGGIGLAPGVIGLGLGILGFLFAHQRRDRRARVLPACGAAVSALAILLSVIALASFVRTMREAERESQAETEKADRERLKAADEVRAAAAGGATRVTAGRFAKAYDDDEDRADRLYKNKVLEITGVVDELDFTGETYSVHLRAGRDLTATCEFAKAPDVRARLARLKPGDQVTIRGKCLGGEAAIEACVLVE